MSISLKPKLLLNVSLRQRPILVGLPISRRLKPLGQGPMGLLNQQQVLPAL